MKNIAETLKHNKKRVLVTILALVVMFTSFGAVKPMTDPENHTETIAALDEKKTTVMELAAASTAASAAITLIPGDTATPIADKLADFLKSKGLDASEVKYNSSTTKDEFGQNRQTSPMIPMPGTYQYQKPVTIVNKWDFD